MQRHLSASTLALLVAPPLFWAGNAVVARALVGVFPPLALSFARWALALLIVLPFTLRGLRESWPSLRGRWVVVDRDQRTRRRLLQLAAVPRSADINSGERDPDRRVGSDREPARRCCVLRRRGASVQWLGCGAIAARRAAGDRARRSDEHCATAPRSRRPDHAGRDAILERLHVAAAHAATRPAGRAFPDAADRARRD